MLNSTCAMLGKGYYSQTRSDPVVLLSHYGGRHRNRDISWRHCSEPLQVGIRSKRQASARVLTSFLIDFCTQVCENPRLIEAWAEFSLAPEEQQSKALGHIERHRRRSFDDVKTICREIGMRKTRLSSFLLLWSGSQAGVHLGLTKRFP